jgi:peptidoglycan/LPS O-acetylase OafA/YrhL
MSDELGAVIVISLLVIAVLRNTGDDDRVAACNTLLWIATPSYYIYSTELYNTVTGYIGYFPYQAIFPLLYILVLSRIKCRLSTCLMAMCMIEISVNIGAFLIEGHKEEVSGTYLNIIWYIFIIEVALMLSRRVTNGVYRGVLRLKLAGLAAKAKLSPDYCADSLHKSSSEAVK